MVLKNNLILFNNYYNKSMKILKKNIRECEMPDWTKTMVLELDYSHKKFTGKIIVKDYNDINYHKILKQLRPEVVKAYNLTKEQWQSAQN